MALLELVEELQHARAPLGGVVETDVKLRDALQAQTASKLPAHERHRPSEGGDRLLALTLLADHADPDARVPKVGRRLDLRDRREADARVRDLARQDLADLL